ncbi:MAG: heparan-alpha-glucosaminide N-acetyltransferase [Pseudomonadota bacterium]
MNTSQGKPSQKRIAELDFARGVALVAMAIYHFTWDLTFFGYLDTSFATTGPMRWFARAIAFSFLFLVGASLVLAHEKGIRWHQFWRRFIAVAACALLISIATWFAVRESFVYFGILHHITVASFLGLAFLRVDWQLLTLFSAVAFGADLFLSSPIFDAPWFWWTGLNRFVRSSNDYVPMLPWFGAVLLGMAFAKSHLIWMVEGRLKTDRAQTVSGMLTWLGQRSLIVYMVHQPILIALIFATSLIVPPTRVDEFAFPPDPFLDACESACLQNSPAEFCIAYCACVDVRLQQQSLKAGLLDGQIALDDPSIVATTNQCTADISEALQEFRSNGQ